MADNALLKHQVADPEQVSAGEEGIAVGSAAALSPDDVIFAQYREAGVFQQRGFTLKDFMNQLFANKNDSGRGRNMPVHYGSKHPRAVSLLSIHFHTERSEGREERAKERLY